MMAVYLSVEARRVLDAAQALINNHLVECAKCRSNRPCYDRIEAERVFIRFGRLPRRTPGLTASRRSASAVEAASRSVRG
jgi:hypothetical protein